jgi:hypothetical protein
LIVAFGDGDDDGELIKLFKSIEEEMCDVGKWFRLSKLWEGA